MTRKIRMLIGLLLALGAAGETPAQIYDGQYWEASISGKTRVVLVAPGGNPAQAELLKGRLKKETVYLFSSWDGGSESYTLDAWTLASGVWVRADQAGTMAPFGDGFPDSKDASLELTLDLTPTPSASEGVGPGVVVQLSGLLGLKFKLAKSNGGDPPPAGVSEVQGLDTGSATGGDFALSFDGATTGLLAFDVSAVGLQAALQSLSTIGAGNLLVQQPAAGTYVLTFAGALSQQDVSQILVDMDSTAGGTGVTTSVITPGMSPPPEPLKSASFELAGVGSTMSSNNFAGLGNEMIGNPKFKAKRIKESKLPFVP